MLSHYPGYASVKDKTSWTGNHWTGLVRALRTGQNLELFKPRVSILTPIWKPFHTGGFRLTSLPMRGKSVGLSRISRSQWSLCTCPVSTFSHSQRVFKSKLFLGACWSAPHWRFLLSWGPILKFSCLSSTNALVSISRRTEPSSSRVSYIFARSSTDSSVSVFSIPKSEARPSAAAVHRALASSKPCKRWEVCIRKSAYRWYVHSLFSGL